MNYLMFEGKKYLLTESEEAVCNTTSNMLPLSSIPAGELCKIDDKEYIVLHHSEVGTELLMKELYTDDEVFGENNNYNGSNVDDICNKYAEHLANVIGADNIIEHTVDLTANDGLKDYGIIVRKASLLTASKARRYVEILDKYKLDKYWWLATPWSTPKHEDDDFSLCVSPRGNINYISYDYYGGVRPFCILKSNILVSK